LFQRFLDTLSQTKESIPYSNQLNKTAKELIEVGIDSSSIDEALTLLLQYESAYIPKYYDSDSKSLMYPSLKKYFYLSIVIFTLLAISPKSIVGIGKNRIKYKLLTTWIRLVTYTLPTTLILSPFWKKLVELIY